MEKFIFGERGVTIRQLEPEEKHDEDSFILVDTEDPEAKWIAWQLLNGKLTKIGQYPDRDKASYTIKKLSEKILKEESEKGNEIDIFSSVWYYITIETSDIDLKLGVVVLP